jgi:signal transduction histidine kinase/ActR/RegA family two-component response regulator
MRDTTNGGNDILKRTFFKFSLGFFFVIFAGTILVFFSTTWRIGNGRLEDELDLMLEAVKLRIVSELNDELSLVLKLADVPLIKRYFLNPSDLRYRELALEEIAAYRRHFDNGTIFWISDVDKIFHYDDGVSYVLDPDDPDSYWYNMTLYQTEKYNFNINYNPELYRTNLWINAPVFDSVPSQGGSGKPIGMLGTGIDLTDFLDGLGSNLDAGKDIYLFNAANEITVAQDHSLIFGKKTIIDHLGRHGEAIAEAVRKPGAPEIQTVSYNNVKYKVSAVPLLGWYIVALTPINMRTLYDPGLGYIFLGIELLALIVFIVSNTFVTVMQKKINEQTSRAESASRAKSEFLARMSHEIRTPLNAIIGLAEIELRKKPAGETGENLSELYKSGSNLLTLINDLLDISKIESGRLELNNAGYDPLALFQECISLNTVRIGEKPIEFKIDIDETLPRQLVGDEIRLREVLNNLLSNAVKYTDRGSIMLRVWHEWNDDDPENCWLVFSVEDTGRGIKPEDLSSLFQEYARYDEQLNRGIEGTGLGLSITKKLVELMGGSIIAKSIYGKGSAFTVTIPQRIGDSMHVGRDAANMVRLSGGEEKRKEVQAIEYMSLPEVSVLVVDDVFANLKVAQGLFRPYGMNVVLAKSGAQAIDILRTPEIRVDIIFMDHMMPGMDGIETVQKIRNEIGGYLTSVPIIALTANAMAGNEQMFLEKGFQDFLSKPVNSMRLDAIIKKWLVNRSRGTAGTA